MTLTLADWLVIAAYLLITILLGFWFRKRSAKSVDDYFVSGRNVNWWLAGTSMVATTFAADTLWSSPASSMRRASAAIGSGGDRSSPA